MKKKQLWIVIAAFIVAIIAIVCAMLLMSRPLTGQVEDAQTSGSAMTQGGSAQSGSTKFGNKHKLLGYEVAYPSDSVLGSAGLGYAFITRKGYSVIMGAPAATGDVVEASSFDDAIEETRQMIFDTLEVRDQDMFMAGNTVQEITSKTEVVNNGVSMLKVKGVFHNTFDSIDIPYVAYYLIYNKYPAYIVGIQLDNNPAGLEEFMDEMASHIRK